MKKQLKIVLSIFLVAYASIDQSCITSGKNVKFLRRIVVFSPKSDHARLQGGTIMTKSHLPDCIPTYVNIYHLFSCIFLFTIRNAWFIYKVIVLQVGSLLYDFICSNREEKSYFKLVNLVNYSSKIKFEKIENAL